jgi:diacylglycerol kinase (ATP)
LIAQQPSVLVYNPAAGLRRAGRRLAAIASCLEAAGFAVELVPTTYPGEASLIARAAAARHDFAVFALGGDGTVREVAAGLLGSATLLAVLPGGTTNVVARALGSPTTPLAAARAAAGWVPRTLDVGLCAERPFLMQVTCGIDADIMAATTGAAKARWGRGAVLAQGLRQWWRYRWQELELEVDGQLTTATYAAVCNLAEYAGPFRLAPHAEPDDGRLDLVLFRGRDRWAYLRFAIDLLRGCHARRRDVEIRSVESVRLLGPEGARVQLDGDPLPLPFPLTITLSAQRLRVLAPAAPGARA